MLSKLFKDLILVISKFPGIGPRQATRIVFWLAQNPGHADNLALALTDFQKNKKICGECFLPFDASEQNGERCRICRDTKRENVLAVVEKETDVIAFEESGVYKGKYFVLGGKISALRKPEKTVHLKELETLLSSRQKENNLPREVIIATSATAEGELTAHEVGKILEKFPAIKTSRLGRGVPVGGEIEFVDPQTLKESFEGRR